MVDLLVGLRPFQGENCLRFRVGSVFLRDTLSQVVESVADFLISSIPFYFLIKLAFLVYLFLPQTQGAKVVYDNVIKVHLVPHLGISASSGKKSD